MIQISMDGPNVNLKFLEDVQHSRADGELHELFDIGSCGFHTIYGAFKTGAEKTEWGIKKILKAVYQIFIILLQSLFIVTSSSFMFYFLF